MIDLTPGWAQAAFELLRLVHAQTLSPQAVVTGFGRVGRLPPDHVLTFVQTLNWVQVEASGLLVLSEAGRRVHGEGGYAAQARRTLLDFARIVSPPWLQNAPYGRSRVLGFATVGAKQLMVEAEVAEGIDEDTVAFWDELAALARRVRDDGLSRIGREGERLTLSYEARRTNRAPRWVSIDSNVDGYDVLSRRSGEDSSALTIEVKTSRTGMGGLLHLTRGEWEAAQESDAHVFHLWDVSQHVPSLAVVSVDEMAGHVARDLGEGLWEGVAVPFRAFRDAFRPTSP